MAEKKTVTLGYTEIKSPFAHLHIGDSDSTCVFFEREKDKIVCWDDLKANYPRWILSIHTRKEAITRIIDMTADDGWDLIETSENELQDLVDKT